MFQSNLTMGAASVLTFVLFLTLVSRRPWWRSVQQSLAFFARDGQSLVWVTAMVSVLLLNGVQLMWEERGFVVPWDLTYLAASVGGSWVPALQNLFMNHSLTYLLTYVYVIVFPVLMMGSMAIYAANHDRKAIQTLALAIIINYSVALPFYVLMPVNEVWNYDHATRHLASTVWPAFETVYRLSSGIMHNFPSLHTSVSITLALVALRGDYVRMGRVLAGLASAIVFSTMYLGIHWPIDLVAGGLLAVFAAQMAHVGVTVLWPKTRPNLARSLHR